MNETNFRHAVEFVMQTSPYTRQDIMRLDCLTFLRVLKECEEKERKAVERLKNREENG